MHGQQNVRKAEVWLLLLLTTYRPHFTCQDTGKTSENFRYVRRAEGSESKQDLPNPQPESHPLRQDVPLTFGIYYVVYSSTASLDPHYRPNNMAPWSRVLSEKLRVTQLIKNYPTL